jgi:predicted TIM-barrel fold metal-dependent hydrolase
MKDWYTHLRMEAPDPVADLQSLMTRAGVSEAIVVETLDGGNRGPVDRIAAGDVSMLRAVYCLRDGIALNVLERPAVMGLRVLTRHLSDSAGWAEALRQSGKALYVHAEQGIAALGVGLGRFAASEPGIAIFVPHMGWPRRDGRDDPDWSPAICDLGGMGTVSIGISAMAHFSWQPYPHTDASPFAHCVFDRFDASRVAAASDYPASCGGDYSQYMNLARDWIRSRWPTWS